ncbi:MULTISPECIES: VOC family protein [Haloferax]|uniref:VOC family protein n=1 Tax=Haloferax marinum TaxID=2666143 RepID=A0A6A8G640_9EURY|nr:MULTISPECIES: VOC family protein [Haloferax]KAB1197486.1 VOC family protein [Haloferax sp. CBA1150]MRW96531.1 VOC family protein [Haloferax marinum]
MARVVHFDIDADDPERAIAFYSEVFGWEFEKWDGPMDYWLVTTGDPDTPGIDGGLAVRSGPAPDDDTPASAYTCTIDVDDVDSVVQSVAEHGGRVVDDVQTIPGVGRLASCVDTEGNRFGVMESDETTA